MMINTNKIIAKRCSSPQSSILNPKPLILLFLCLLPLLSFAAIKNAINKISLIHNDRFTRLIIQTQSPAKYKTFYLAHPDRFIVDFDSTQLKTNLKKLPLSQIPTIKKVRYGKPKPNVLRLVFELTQPLKSSTYTLKPKGHLANRLVINLSSRTKSAKPHPTTTITPTQKKSKSTSITPPTKKPTVTFSAANYQQASKHRKVVVIIDPGHGGKDPGAIGKMGTREKKVVLQIAKNLYDTLKKNPAIEPHLTRYHDNFISLRGRLRVARKEGADLFIAIHADAFYDHRAQGATVFALSQHGASSESARWLAQRENYSELAGINLTDKNRLLRSVLLDLSQTTTISQGLLFGNLVRDSLGRVTKLHSHIVEQAAFVVLKSPDIPSLLVETGFLSNRAQEKKLATGAFQQKLAKALAQGIENYLKKYPPQGTLFAKK